MLTIGMGGQVLFSFAFVLCSPSRFPRRIGACVCDWSIALLHPLQLQSQGQYRAQMFLYAVLGAPLVLGNDIRAMDNFTFSLVTAPEVLAIDQDAACLQVG